MSVRFVADERAAGLLGRSTEMAAYLKEVAEAVAEVVRSIGPKGNSAEHYVDEIEVVVGVEGSSLIGRVNARKFTSAWIEFGTSLGFPAHAPLRRAAESVGLRLARSRRG